MPNLQLEKASSAQSSLPGLVNPRFVRVEELDRLLDAIAVVAARLEMEADGALVLG